MLNTYGSANQLNTQPKFNPHNASSSYVTLLLFSDNKTESEDKYLVQNCQLVYDR